MSDSDADLSVLLARLQGCRDEEAVALLWDAVFHHIVSIAQKRMARGDERFIDSEDIALSAIQSFVRAAESGRLPNLKSSEELWRVLVTITIRKIYTCFRNQTAAKRGGGEVRGDSVFDISSSRNGFDQIIDPGHPDRFVDSLLGECRERLQSLPERELRLIALRRMEGFDVAEIAAELGVATATVKRKLARIRILWTDSSSGTPPDATAQ